MRLFSSEMAYPMGTMEDRFSKLELEGKNMETLTYATQEDCNVVTTVLANVGPNYNESYRLKSQLKNVPLFAGFLNCTQHLSHNGIFSGVQVMRCRWM